jgi:hypothetical protein
MAAAAVVVAAVAAAAIAGGWDVAGWLGEVWTSLASVSVLFLVPALALQTLQTGFAAMAWYGILRFAYPQGEVPYLAVLACYATGAALNSVTPAHAGTLVTVLMFVAIIPTATVTGVLAASAVEKLLFAVIGLLVYVYLFLAVGGSFERKSTNAATASAYSIGQQLLTTVWNFVLAVVLVAAAFGRSGGKRLVEESSAQARELQARGDDVARGTGGGS